MQLQTTLVKLLNCIRKDLIIRHERCEFFHVSTSCNLIYLIDTSENDK